MWAHALAADVATALRIALDDSAAAVVTAAARALAELVSVDGLGPLHAAAWQLPRVPARCLARPHPAGAWTAHAVERAPAGGSAESHPPQHPLLGQAEEEEDAPDERQVARSDPLCGLLQMQARTRSPLGS